MAASDAEGVETRRPGAPPPAIDEKPRELERILEPSHTPVRLGLFAPVSRTVTSYTPSTLSFHIYSVLTLSMCVMV